MGNAELLQSKNIVNKVFIAKKTKRKQKLNKNV